MAVRCVAVANRHIKRLQHNKIAKSVKKRKEKQKEAATWT